MNVHSFNELLLQQHDDDKEVCLGLDSDAGVDGGKSKIPEAVRGDSVGEILLSFNKAIVQATYDVVCCYKPNIAFYEAWGAEGMLALKKTSDFIREIAPGVPIVGDEKRGDIGNTNLGYVLAAFNYFGFDAITVPPYMGRKSLDPFLRMRNKGVLVLCRTSNEGADEFQGLYALPFDPADIPTDVSIEAWLRKIIEERKRLYQHVASNVANNWNEYGNCGLVVGATCPEELEDVCEVVGSEMTLLIPGIGKQGGDLERAVRAGNGMKKVFNSSREILYASGGADFAEVARQKVIDLQWQINQYRQLPK